MKYAAELAAAQMEKKSAIGVSTAILLALMATPFVTRGLNWASGYDPKAEIKKQEQLLAQQPAQPQAPTDPTGSELLAPAQGLHDSRAGAR